MPDFCVSQIHLLLAFPAGNGAFCFFGIVVTFTVKGDLITAYRLTTALLIVDHLFKICLQPALPSRQSR